MRAPAFARAVRVLRRAGQAVPGIAVDLLAAWRGARPAFDLPPAACAPPATVTLGPDGPPPDPAALDVPGTRPQDRRPGDTI